MKPKRLTVRRRLEALEREVAALKEKLQAGEGNPLLADARAAGVPLSQVINEYFWGKEENDD